MRRRRPHQTPRSRHRSPWAAGMAAVALLGLALAALLFAAVRAVP